MKKIIACLLTAVGLTTACGQKNYANTDTQGFAELIDSPDVVLVDVRSQSEYREGHLSGALNIDQSESDFIEKASAALPKEKTIAVYCRSGRRSASAASRLAAEGYRVVNLKGGIMAWKEEGMPVTTSSRHHSD